MLRDALSEFAGSGYQSLLCPAREANVDYNSSEPGYGISRPSLLVLVVCLKPFRGHANQQIKPDDTSKPSLLTIAEYALDIDADIDHHPRIRLQSRVNKSTLNISAILPRNTIHAAVNENATTSTPNVLQRAANSSRGILFTVGATADSARRILGLLYLTEYLLLIEYTEVMTPIVYCIYMIVVSHIPNRAFYANLKEADDDSIVHNIDNIMLYGSLELLSYALGWKLRVSLIHQFAFVLETQWDLV